MRKLSTSPSNRLSGNFPARFLQPVLHVIPRLLDQGPYREEIYQAPGLFRIMESDRIPQPR